MSGGYQRTLARAVAASSEVEVSKSSRFSNDFQRWLHENGYGHHDFATSEPMLASQQHHSKKYLEEVHAFIEVVKEYTGAEKVDVVGHSMGVTLARKALQGGDGFDPYAFQR